MLNHSNDWYGNFTLTSFLSGAGEDWGSYEGEDYSYIALGY